MEIVGITVTNGRRTLEDATTDALLAVTLAGAHIPIYKGTFFHFYLLRFQSGDDAQPYIPKVH